MEVSEEGIRRVQSIAQSPLSRVPPEYIQHPNTRPVFNTPTQPHNVPLIDLSFFDPTRRTSTRESIARACRDWGAFHVTNHGVPLSLLTAIRRVGRAFFSDCSMPEKLRYACSTAASEGYGSKMLATSDQKQDDAVAQVLDWRDYFDHHTLPSLGGTLIGGRSFHPITGTRWRGLRASCIEDAVGEFYQNITISYYPPCPEPDLTLGLQSHSDMGAITLLIQDDVEGLQALKSGDGGGDQWVTVEPLSDAVLVLLGDQTETFKKFFWHQIITNGKYRSCEHRAITNPDRARLSVATFHDPAKTVKISPASELINESSPAKYRDVVYGDHVLSWYTKGPEGKRNIDALLLHS
ncbi:hypothetical protein ACSQ67_012026 [Phaseolus vulgaris]